MGEAEERAAEAVDKMVEPQPQSQEVLPARRPATAPLQATETGLLVGSTFEEQFRLARAYHASRLMPDALDTPEKVLVAIQLCRELNLPPMTSIGKIAVINGVPSIFGDLPLALVQRSGKLEYIHETLFDDKNEPLDLTKPLPAFFGARCEVKRHGQPDPVIRVFTQHDAVKGGIWGKKVWAVYPKRMMQMRCRGWALKDAFSDVLLGIAIAEYDFDTLPGTDDRGMPQKVLTAADEINKTYGGEETTTQEPGAAQ